MKFFSVPVLLTAVLLSGCSIVAPKYSPSIENVQRLRDGDVAAAKLGKFESGGEHSGAKGISLRGSTMTSPYEYTYNAYLAEAIKQDLFLAGKLKEDSELEISGVLLKNDIDASGFSTASGVIDAQFVVRKSTKIKYDAVKSVQYQWDSSFAGAIAIPKAQQEYVNLIHKLLEVLYSDKAFLDALK